MVVFEVICDNEVKEKDFYKKQLDDVFEKLVKVRKQNFEFEQIIVEKKLQFEEYEKLLMEKDNEIKNLKVSKEFL